MSISPRRNVLLGVTAVIAITITIFLLAISTSTDFAANSRPVSPRVEKKLNSALKQLFRLQENITDLGEQISILLHPSQPERDEALRKWIQKKDAGEFKKKVIQNYRKRL